MAEILERGSNHATNLVLREPFGERVQWQEAHLRLVLGAIQPSNSRVRHLPPLSAESWCARQQHVLSLAKLFPHERLVKPHGTKVLAALPNQHAHGGFSETAATRVDLDDLAADSLYVILLQIADCPAIGEIFIVTGK